MGGRTTEAQRPAPSDYHAPKQARRGRVAILFSEDAAERLADAEVALVVASPEDIPAAQREVEKARAEVEKATVVYHFQAIGQVAYAALQAEHPPTDAELAEYQAKKAAEAAKDLGDREYVDPPVVNAETWPPALIHASLVEPAMTLEEVRALASDPSWNTAEVQELYDKALQVNTTLRRVSAGKGSGSTRR